MIKNTNSLLAVQELINRLAPIFGYALGFTFQPCLITAATNLSKMYHELSFMAKHLSNAPLSDKQFKDMVDKINGYEVFTMTAQAATGVLATEATLHGVTSIKDTAKILDSGFVWANTANPTVADNKISIKGAGPFSYLLAAIPATTTFYVKVYVTTALGTVYSNQITFTTTA
jgi:hypothetical protein